MIRLPATGKKAGSLLVNPGGPGASGVAFVKGNKAAVSAAVRERFDIVGFDPRGVGASSPVKCFGPLDLDAYFAVDPTPDTRAEAKLAQRWDRLFAKFCAKNSTKKLLAQVNTVNAARDMDVMRAALGDERLTYLGFSYGTYLGSIYADLYPRRIRAMVLDGAEDPSQTGAEFGRDQDRGFQVATASFLRDCFRTKGCPFKKHTVKAALKKLDQLYLRADIAPLRNAYDSRQVNEAVVRTAVEYSMYSTALWPRLRQALTDASKGEGARLLLLADESNGRRADGTYDNDFAALMAINCVDHPESPCAYWPVKGKRYPKKVRAAGSPPIVVVGTTRDPATPYKLARSLAGQLRNGVLLTNDADGHTAYSGGESCLERQIDRYLITTRAPQPKACTKA
ncbi:alpha/beta hydrolase fold [Nonomuraea solani]|uniref:Alpha/beta hydrolase fold n=2 Tax=Nonomuraea solani TaxID=1144553 RepID=A0A1H6EIZ1_9ACTN|nr:alpha/beta hydrolase fold [Nonomuraea solani]